MPIRDVYQVASCSNAADEEEQLVKEGLYSRRESWQENRWRLMVMEGVEEEEDDWIC